VTRKPKKRAQPLRITKPYTSSYPGHSGYDRVLYDYYREPIRSVDLVLDHEPFVGSVLDPCMGGGTIPARCRARGIEADGSDLQSIAGCRVRDVFSITEEHDNFMLNPPFKPAEPILRHLWPLTRYKLVVLIRHNFLFSAKRDDFFAMMPLARVYYLSQRPSCPPGIYQGIRDNYGYLIQPEEKGGKMDYVWLVIERGHVGPWTGYRL
jgi:hypothetical protein